MAKDKLTYAQANLIQDMAWPGAVVKGVYAKYIASPHHSVRHWSLNTGHSKSTFVALIKRGYLVPLGKEGDSQELRMTYVLSPEGIAAYNESDWSKIVGSVNNQRFEELLESNRRWYEKAQLEKESKLNLERSVRQRKIQELTEAITEAEFIESEMHLKGYASVNITPAQWALIVNALNQELFKIQKENESAGKNS